MVLSEPQRRMKMSSRCRSVCAAAAATEAVSLWRSQSPHTSMAGTLGSTTNCSLRKLRRARIGDFRFSKRPTPRGRKESRDGSCLSVLLWFGRTQEEYYRVCVVGRGQGEEP